MKPGCKYLQVSALILTGVFATDANASNKKRSDSYAPLVRKVTPELLKGKIAFQRSDLSGSLRLISPDGKTRAILPEYFYSGPRDSTSLRDSFSVTPDRRFYVQSGLGSKGDPITNEGSFHSRIIGVYSLNGKRIRQISEWRGWHIDQMRLSPDGKYVAYQLDHFQSRGNGYASYQVAVARLDGATFKKLDQWSQQQRETTLNHQTFISWGRDSQQLLCKSLHQIDAGAFNDGELFVTDINGSFVKKYDGDWSRFALPEVSPNGQQRIVLSSPHSRYTNSDLVLENRAGEAQTLKAGPISGAQWNSDGKWISFLLQTNTDPNISTNNLKARFSLCVIQPDGRNFRILLRDLPMIDHFWMPS